MFDIEVNVKNLQERLSPLVVRRLRPLAGGASSLSYVGTAGLDGSERLVVVKMAPAGLEPVRNRDVLRQARVLRALSPTAVPVPEVLWEDPGSPPETPPLFVMSFVGGTSLEPLFDRNGTDAPSEVAARINDAARVLALLHRVVPNDLAVGSEPVVAVTDEVHRWSRALQTVDQGCVRGWQAIADALAARAPAPMPAAIVHGDFRLGNLLAVGSEITAVVDWEIWSIGDPRVDLGWFLLNADPATYRRDSIYVGALPTPTDLAEMYAEHLERTVGDVSWFHALACFKATATWGLIVKHNRRRTEPDPTSEAMAEVLPALLDRAADLLGVAAPPH